jgi:hypothetical protein
MRRISGLAIPLLLAGYIAAGSNRFVPFRPNSTWTMKNVGSGALTQFTIVGTKRGDAYGCYIAKASNQIVDFQIKKTDISTYWEPLKPWNLDWWLCNDPVFGWHPIMLWVTDFDGKPVETVYYFQPPNTPGEALFGEDVSVYDTIYEMGVKSNHCPKYTGVYPGRWSAAKETTTVDTPAYSGPALKMTYREGNVSHGYGYEERWYFSPSGDLVRIDPYLRDGIPQNMVLQTEKKPKN